MVSYLFFLLKKTPQTKVWGVNTHLCEIISLLTFRYLEKPENTGFGADGVAYLNLTGGCPLLLTTTNNAFQRKDNDYE